MGRSKSTRVWYTADQFIDVKPPLAWDDIKLDAPYRINIPAKDVTDEGMSEVRFYIWNQTGHKLPVIFSSEWLVTNKTLDAGRVGTMPKRVSKYLYNNHKLKVSSSFMAAIGNIARAHTVKEDIFIFDITQSLDWDAGDFGDDGSCYFGGEYNHSRLGLIDAEQYALRLFRYKDEREETLRLIAIPNRRWRCRRTNETITHADPDTCKCLYCRTARSTKKFDLSKYGDILLTEDVVEYRTYPTGAGYGRAWLVEQDNNLVTFNAYGEYQLMQISRILSTIMGKSYRKTDVKHYGSGLYLNGDGCVIGSDVSDIRHVMLKFDIPATEPMALCEMCELEVPENDILWFHDTIMCNDCYNSRTAQCESCSETMWTEDLCFVGGNLLCLECYNDNASECVTCEKRFMNDELYIHADKFYCQECKINNEKDKETKDAV